jgi:nitroreductase
MTRLAQILDLARWAPSGDNTQPWRFSMKSDDHITVYGHDTRAHCVYDLDGRPSQISLGALLETIVIAGTRFGVEASVRRRTGSSDDRPVFDVQLQQKAVAEDPLAAQIRERRVQRRPLHLRSLTAAEKRALEQAVAPGFRLAWFEGWSGRTRMAWLNFTNAKLRLTLPEAYPVHRDVIEWGARTSEGRIPSAALGASAPSLALMRWAMASWERLAFLNRYLGGTIAARLELDLLPGLACAAHCVLVAPRPPAALEDYVAAGRAVQRFWLTATGLGLQFQPQYTPLVFARYARDGVRFSATPDAMPQAEHILCVLEGLLGAEVARRAMFMGRIGAGKAAQARSLRLPLERLLATPPA